MAQPRPATLLLPATLRMWQPRRTSQRLWSTCLLLRLLRRTNNSRVSRTGANRTKPNLMRPRRIREWRPRKYRPDTAITLLPLMQRRLTRVGAPPIVHPLQAMPVALRPTPQVAALIPLPPQPIVPLYRMVLPPPTVLAQPVSRRLITRLHLLRIIRVAAHRAVEDTTLAVEVAADRMHPVVTAEATVANCLPVIEDQKRVA
jgi:hypothetical protein